VKRLIEDPRGGSSLEKLGRRLGAVQRLAAEFRECLLQSVGDVMPVRAHRDMSEYFDSLHGVGEAQIYGIVLIRCDVQDVDAHGPDRSDMTRLGRSPFDSHPLAADAHS
jgi:hypothetical protein